MGSNYDRSAHETRLGLGWGRKEAQSFVFRMSQNNSASSNPNIDEALVHSKISAV